MAEKPSRAPFQSGVTNYSDIRKRMDELGILDKAGDKAEGVSILPVPEPKQEPGFYVYG